MTKTMAEVIDCETHHWVSINVPGLLTRWVIQCSLCGAYNVQEMNAALTAAGYGLVADAKREALLHAAEALDLQPPKLKAQYVGVLLAYATEPWRLETNPYRAADARQP